MSEDTKRIYDKIKQAVSEEMAQGKATPERIHAVVAEGVSTAMREGKIGASEAATHGREALRAATDAAREVGGDVCQAAGAAVNGVAEGIRQTGVDAYASLASEVEDAAQAAEKREEALRGDLRAALQAARSEAESLGTDVRQAVEEAVVKAKLVSLDVLRQTREATRHAVSEAIAKGEAAEETVQQITREATARALQGGTLTAERVQRVTCEVVEGAVEAAVASGSSVKEITGAAVRGSRAAFDDLTEAARQTLAVAGKKGVELAKDDLRRTDAHLATLEELFLDTLCGIGERASGAVREAIEEVKASGKQALVKGQERSRRLGERAAGAIGKASQSAVHKAGELTREAASAAADEARELGLSLLAVAKGAATGMVRGAKDALREKAQADESVEDKDTDAPKV